MTTSSATDSTEAFIVSRDDLEERLAQLRSEVKTPHLGLYGPGTISWEIDRESVVMLGGGCAALLQLAHPYVAHAIDQHSKTRSDPLGRFQRTFRNVFAMVFGDLDQALRSARRVHTMHTRMTGEITEDVGRFARGHRYAANDEAALFWVHATLAHTAMQVFELTVRPLSAEEREQYYRGSKRFACLFGIRESSMPPTWRAFEQYFIDMVASDTIAVGAVGSDIGRFLFTPSSRLHMPILGWLKVFTAGLLPAKLREPFGLRWGRREAFLFKRSCSILGTLHRASPERTHHFPDYHEALLRLDGKPPHDRVGRAVEKLALDFLAIGREAPAGG